MQSTIPVKELSFSPESPLVTSSYLGIMSDLLFRMIIGGDSFDYRQTIAFHENFQFTQQEFEEPLAIKTLQLICDSAFRNYYRFNRLLEGGFIKFLDIVEVKQTDLALQQAAHQKSADLDYIFELTTFAVIEAFFRSGKLPKIFTDNIKNFLLTNGYIKEITLDHYYNPETDESLIVNRKKNTAIVTLKIERTNYLEKIV